MTVRQRDVELLDAFRKKRNTCDYERAGVVSTAEAKEIASLAKTLLQQLKEWLRTKYPALLPN
ncbi:MAG: hypothetical protein ACKV2Q_31945 [Planctomycetaceae bacterium]